MRLVLASASPRRRALLEQLGLAFDVVPADVDETPRAGEPARAYVERLAAEKAAVVAARAPGALVLAADTAVVVDGDILGKPGASADAGRAMLARLSGRTHEVLTGVAVDGPRRLGCTVETAVRFRPLSPDEVRWYVATGEGQDKAGGYAVQGRAGAFVTALEGSPSNVVGLPLAEALALVRAAGLPLPWDVR